MTVELILSGDAGEVRRAVGPTAWAVLETLAAGASDPTGEFAVATNVRCLAAEVGVGRDAAASALRVLVVAGLVRSEPVRRSDGRFGERRYVVTTGDVFRRIAPAAAPVRRVPHPDLDQLSLLDALPDATTTSASPVRRASTTAGTDECKPVRVEGGHR